jgi:pimeloyl-ACP methyl ester carboxylesterase
MSLPKWPWPGISPQISRRSLVVNDLNVHFLESRPDQSNKSGSPARLILLLHGFPELAYSWRKIIVPLSQAGYYVVAPDLRGFGLTTFPSDADLKRVQYDDDISPFRILNHCKDVVSLVYALGYTSAAAVVGHDVGSIVAGTCALIRPDLFKSVVMMSAPFPGAPQLPSNASSTSALRPTGSLLNEQLSLLSPPRKYYWSYFCTPNANTCSIHHKASTLFFVPIIV